MPNSETDPNQKPNLLFISTAPHYLHDGSIVGWGPTVEEIDHLAKIFGQITHVAVLYPTQAPDFAIPYSAPNVNFIPLPPSGGDRFLDKLGILKLSPQYISVLQHQFSKADVVHVRCPANIPILALILLALRRTPKYRWFKFAGNWMLEGKQPKTYYFQKWWLQHNLSRGIVTINGKWKNQPPHIHSFANPCLSNEELRSAAEIGLQKKLTPPYGFVFVARLEERKGLERVIEIALHLHKENIPIEFHIVGDGSARQKYERISKENGLQSKVHFYGWLPKDKIGKLYSQSHFFPLPSLSEGWPKVLSEGMAYGVVPIAGTVSSIPQILAEYGCGDAVPPLDTQAFIDRIQHYISHPEEWKTKSRAGVENAKFFTYETYIHELRTIFNQSWGLEL